MFEIEMQITNRPNLEICERVDKWISYKKKKRIDPAFNNVFE